MSWELNDKQGPNAPLNPHPEERAWESHTLQLSLLQGMEEGALRRTDSAEGFGCSGPLKVNIAVVSRAPLVSREGKLFKPDDRSLWQAPSYAW